MKKAGKIIGMIVLVAVVAGAVCVGFYFVKDKLPWNKEEEGAEYHITYNDASGNVQTVAVKEGMPYSVVVPEKEGYAFKGLFDQPNGGVQYVGVNGMSVLNWTETGDRNLFAQWSPKNIKLLFDLQQGTGAESELTAVYDAAINAFSVPRKDGHDFLGWYDGTNEEASAYSDANGIPLKSVMTYTNYPAARAEDTVRLYAKWEARLISVTFSTNKGAIHSSLGSATVTKTVEIPYGSKIDAYLPEESGFGKTVDAGSNGAWGIAGWSLNRNGNTAFTDTITEPVDLFAIWQPAIIFDMGNEAPIDAIVAKAGEEISLPIISKTGYAFLGWEDGAQYDFEPTEMPSGGAVVHPNWELEVYSITYILNGGTEMNGAPANYTVETAEFSLPETSVKQHYRFEGWYGNEEFVGQRVVTLGKGVDIAGDLKLYAKWSPVTYVFTFESNIGTVVDPIQYTVETQKFALPTLSKVYYVFEGWYADPNFAGNPISEAGQGTGIGSDLALYAKWRQAYEDYTYVSSRADMMKIHSNLGGKYMLIKDVDLGEWTPIGSWIWNRGVSPATPFTGTFDGQNFHLKYQISIGNYGASSGNDCAWGVFGACVGAKFVNMYVTANIYGDGNGREKSHSPHAGGIVGMATNCYFENCSVYGAINQNGNGGDDYGCPRSGGIAGIAYSTVFKNCVNRAKVFAIGFYATSGGIVGGAYGSGASKCDYIGCFNWGDVSASHGKWVFGSHNSGDIYGTI